MSHRNSNVSVSNGGDVGSGQRPAVRRWHRLTSMAFLLAGAAPSLASAQWTVVNLHPPAVLGSSETLAADGANQAGFVNENSTFRTASAWNGTASSWVNLAPPGVFYSEALGVAGGQQVGFVRLGGPERASLWFGTAESWVDLTPASAGYARGTDGVHQVGWASVGGILRASLWSGTAASWVDLHPSVAYRSTASACSGGQQVGNAQIGFEDHASLWSGTAASWVDLHPPGATLSFAVALSGGQQAGIVQMDGKWRGSVWSGTAESWVDLTPAGADESLIYGVLDGMQVGFVGSQASLWYGTADSWIDLGASLPPGFLFSAAFGISKDSDNMYVVGYGYNLARDATDAMLWVRPLCSAPDITRHPVVQSPCRGSAATFTVAAHGTAGPFTYQWRKDGVPIDSSETGNPSAATATLMLDDISLADGGAYDVVVSSAGDCGSTISFPADLIVCVGDADCDLDTDSDDIILFFGAWDNAELTADVDGDGDTDSDDIIRFFAVWESGC